MLFEDGALGREVNKPALPVLNVWPALRDAVKSNSIVLFSAPPGAGKSTVIPLEFLQLPSFAKTKIILVQPRRIAAIAVANRMADLLGERVGQTIGYQVRHERKLGSSTRLEVVTDGIMLHRLQQDPY